MVSQILHASGVVLVVSTPLSFCQMGSIGVQALS